MLIDMDSRVRGSDEKPSRYTLSFPALKEWGFPRSGSDYTHDYAIIGLLDEVLIMPGLDHTTPHPTEIILHKKSCILEVAFDDGSRFQLPAEFLRVYSPSAEVRGHGKGQETLQTGKRDITILSLEPVGSYGIKPTFSDGHDSGIFSWDVLHYLGANQAALWADYLERLAAAGAHREASTHPQSPISGCNNHQ